ncbi:AmiS/UreI family transporter [Puniceibacterium confluentis]|uniref:AmiS/UreI family transporter n=1 Tax=Puniceibacterium confluentis TaxID=1958944 RepID=UPI0011B6A991|nr:AmiS/UreI family transporter [Puniceibacterium confluentis]
MLLPLSLLFVGAVLVLNGLWMSGRIDDREIVLINGATAAITAAVATVSLVRAENVEDVRAVAMTLLFSVTYLWVAFNRVSGSDGRGLGWFSLFVALSVLPEAIRTLSTASSVMETWLGLCWLAWAGLWFLYFLTLAMQRSFRKQTALATLLSGVLTAWLPALFLMYGSQT